MHKHSNENISHNHSHEGHNHGKVIALTDISNAFIIGIILNMAYVIIQVLVGFRINSLALLSDAGHNFLDVGALALSLLAFKLNKAKASHKYTYGFKKSSILISLFNAVILLVAIGAISYETIFRFKNPQPLPGLTVAVVSAIGIFINGISAFMFFRNKDKDLNIKSAFLHLAADAAVSLGLVIGGVVMYYTHIYWIDPLLSLIVCAIIIVSTWNLLKDSLRLSMDGVPDNIELEKIKTCALKVKGVIELHHIHIWAISTTENALTAHLIVDEASTMQQIQNIKAEVKHQLEHENIQHATLETETKRIGCDGINC